MDQDGLFNSWLQISDGRWRAIVDMSPGKEIKEITNGTYAELGESGYQLGAYAFDYGDRRIGRDWKFCARSCFDRFLFENRGDLERGHDPIFSFRGSQLTVTWMGKINLFGVFFGEPG